MKSRTRWRYLARAPVAAARLFARGRYDFTLEYTDNIPGGTTGGPAQPAAIPDIFTALQQQLGLQLIAKKLPFDVVAVESANEVPAEN